QRLLREPERAAGHRRDQRHLVAVAQLSIARGVLLVHGVEQALRFRAEVELVPDVPDTRRVDLACRPTGTLAQSGEQTDRHPHAAKGTRARQVDELDVSVDSTGTVCGWSDVVAGAS